MSNSGEIHPSAVTACSPSTVCTSPRARGEPIVLLGDTGTGKSHLQARIARELNVSEATVSRDLKAMFPGAITCPTCRCWHSHARWRELERQGHVKFCSAPHPQNEKFKA